MKHNFNRLLSLGLIVVLLFGMFCVGVSAADQIEISGQNSPWNNNVEDSYTISIVDTGTGKTTANMYSATEGETVILTVSPKGSCELQTIGVFDSTNRPVELKKVNEKTYTFVMPASDVIVKAVYDTEMLITDDHFAYIQGYPDGTFGSDRGLTRAEAATIFYRLLINKDYKASDLSFDDVKEGAWYYTAVMTLANKGILEGYPDGTFQPNRAVTRAEFCAIASRFYSMREGTVLFTDVKEGAWYYPYIVNVVAKGWMTDAACAYQPNEPISRKEVVGIVNGMLHREADVLFIQANIESLVSFTDVPVTADYYYDVMEAANGHEFEVEEKTEVETWIALK